MALPADTVFEIRSGGDDDNGGGFSLVKALGSAVDKSQQDAAEYSASDGAVAAGADIKIFTSAGVTFVEDDTYANCIHIISGTNVTAGWYMVESWTDANTIVLDRSPTPDSAAASSVVYKIGGALKTPGGLGAILSAHGVAWMEAHMKSGDYPLTSSSLNVAGGGLDLSGTMANKHFKLTGYETTREDYTGTRPQITNLDDYTPTQVIKLSGSSSYQQYITNVNMDGHSQEIDGITGPSINYNFTTHCEVTNCDGASAFNGLTALYCKAYSCDATGFSGAYAHRCWADYCTTGFGGATSCIASNCNYGFSGYGVWYFECISYKSTSHGFYQALSFRGSKFVNCVSWDSGGYSFYHTNQSVLLNCAGGDYTSGRLSADAVIDIDGIDGSTLTVDPFEDAANGDFRLNDTAGGGLVLQAAGIGVVGQTDTPDVNAVSAVRGAGGGGGIVGMSMLAGRQK